MAWPKTKMTWMKYLSLLERVSEANGTPVDLSYYPSYVNSAEDRETAIILEKGKALYKWKMNDFYIQLGWTGGIAFLSYKHLELESVVNYLSEGEGF